MKICSKCKTEKDESEFFLHKLAKDGLQSKCKLCCKEYQKSENIKKSKKKYKESEKYKIKRKEYYQSDKYKEYQKSKKRKEYLDKYNQTETRKQSVKKYNQTENRKNRKSVIIACLGFKKIPTNQIPPELIELKGLQLKIKRELKKWSTK